MKRSNIGGQAVLEGVMMRGKKSMATAVRNTSGEITVESKRLKSNNKIWNKIPIIRGVINFVSMLILGTKVLMRSSEVFGEDTEPSKFEKWLAKTFKVDLMQVVMVFSVVLGLALAIALFFILPQVLASLFYKIPNISNASLIVKEITEGIIRLLIFVGYIYLCSKVKDIKRVFMYHGAEHKTINAFEHEEILTVENVQKYSTVHNRCGTTFLFIVMVISILLFALAGWISIDVFKWEYTIWTRLAVRLVLLPIVAGVSYEVLKLLALSDNIVVRILRWPGLLLQKLTTKQPDDQMVEVAITAFRTVYDMEQDDTIPEQKFDIQIPYKKAREKLQEILPASEFESADIDWIFADVLKKTRCELNDVKFISESDFLKAEKFAKERATHKPLQYVLGHTEFYGIKIRVNSDVLIPRPETELLAEQVIKIAEGKKILDLCTGSGAIAIAVKQNINCDMTASDISEKALELAKYNADIYKANDIKFIKSNLFESIIDKFDIIVSNPPYIPTSDIENLDIDVKNYEPKLALDGGKKGLDFYKEIAQKAPEFLADNGQIVLEIGINQIEDVKNLLSENFKIEKIIKDYNSIDRIIIAKKI